MVLIQRTRFVNCAGFNTHANVCASHFLSTQTCCAFLLACGQGQGVFKLVLIVLPEAIVILDKIGDCQACEMQRRTQRRLKLEARLEKTVTALYCTEFICDSS